MDYDFQIFQLQILYSLKQNAPLRENLRAIMAPVLSKLKKFTDAQIAIHSFMNRYNNRLDSMVLGEDPQTDEALFDELARRNQGGHGTQSLSQNIPDYFKVVMPEDNTIKEAIIKAFELNEIDATTVEPIKWLFDKCKANRSKEFLGLPEIKNNDIIIIIPLGAGQYNMLGSFFLWTSGDALRNFVDGSFNYERLIAFRKSMEQMLIRIFTNFYQMNEHTYLPTYYQVEPKEVALLCAEIRGFEKIYETLQKETQLNENEKADCLRRLVNRFSKISAEVIEECNGRIGQQWGNSLLAFFGENVTTTDRTGSSYCLYAVQSAATIIEKFPDKVKKWLKKDCCLKEINRLRYEKKIELTPEIVIAIHYGLASFDYIGSLRNLAYMAIGDSVNLVKQLANVAGRRTKSKSTSKKPILVSRTAYNLCGNSVLKHSHRPINPRTIRLLNNEIKPEIYELRSKDIETKVT